jgi:hypothetical protein
MTTPRHPGRRRHRPGGWPARPDLGTGRWAGYRRQLGFARAQVPGRRCWAVEGWRQLRGRPGGLPAGPRRAGGGGRPAPAAAAAQRGQERRPGRRPRRPGGAAGAFGDPPRRVCGQGGCHQPARGADRGGAGGAAGRAAWAWDQAAGHPLRRAVGAAGPVAGASHDRAGTQVDRPTHPGVGWRGRRARGRAGAAADRLAARPATSIGRHRSAGAWPPPCCLSARSGSQ